MPELQPPPMSIRQAARWAERVDRVFRVRDGKADWMCAAVDIGTNQVLAMGFGDTAYDFHRTHPELSIRVYTLAEVLDGISEEEGEQACPPGPRDVDAGLI